MRRFLAGGRRSWLLLALSVFAFLLVSGGTAVALTGDDTPSFNPGVKAIEDNDENEAQLLEQDLFQTGSQLAGDTTLDIGQAASLRLNGLANGKKLGLAKGSEAAPFSGTWKSLGPNPVVQVQRGDSAFAAISGRIGALAIEPNGRFILGAASGGIWTMDPPAAPGTYFHNGIWVPRTSDADTQTIGAITIAPSNANIVYAGTGEGALSGDSVYGDGILKSTDGGTTWSHVSGDYFVGVSISRVVVDPHNANHLYVAVDRGRSGERRVSVTVHSRFGIWESNDGGQTFNLLREVPEINGATDLEMDPQNSSILYASFWGDAMYRSTDAGHTWTPIMNGLPAGANYLSAGTRFSIAIAHPSPAAPAVLYSGFDWNNADGTHHKPEVWKSIDGGNSWTVLPGGTKPDNVENYCATSGSQCSYDNVIEVDPSNPDVVYAAGSYGYDLSPQSGGIYRSTDGGQHWLNLGWDLHPDFHALAMDPNNHDHVLVGNDGGVWYSPDRGGRASSTQPLNSVDWQDLNGEVNPNTAAVIHRTGLDIAQYSSIATVPTVPPGADSPRFWGGTQDNGTQRKSVNSPTWFDVASGDGGQVLVDPTNDAANNNCPLGACFVYGTYPGFSAALYRYTDGGQVFFSNQFIQNGLNQRDRSEFYVPYVLSPNNPNQLYVGSYRMYRTDDARSSATWHVISPDLTTGCPGTAPNGARGCVISAIGVGGGTAVYAGTLDGNVWFSPDAQTASSPTWTKVDNQANNLPSRPVSDLAVDRSNNRIAYLAYNGYDEATPGAPGHAFATTDGGVHWTNITGNLPDVPLNSLIADPAYPNTLYAGTQVGTFVTTNGGVRWHVLGDGMPNVSVWQLDLDPLHRVLAAGTHGRGAYMLTDSTPAPALVLSKVDSGVPVGPASNLKYTITVKNIGNADAKNVKIADPIPANTTFVSASDGGQVVGGSVMWTGLSAPSGGSVSVTLTVKISPSLDSSVKSIIDDGMSASAAGGASVTGSPVVTPIAPQFAVSASPASQTGAAHVGSSVDYTVALKNLGYTPDSYSLASSGGTYTVSFRNSDCSAAMSTTPVVQPGDTTNVCVRVTVPANAADGDNSTSTVTATSVGSPSVSASVSVKTIAVAKDTLLVDEDGGGPNVESYYKTALTANGVDFSYWDLAANPTLPFKYLNAFKNVYWFTGNSYPGPITPYEAQLKSFLDGGGHLFMSGQDILDQGAGTTAFVHDYLHITWDGSETQNDKATVNVHGVTGNVVTNGIGSVPLDHSVLGANFEDEITPNGSAASAFTDDAAKTDALTFSGTYKVVFLAFPMEAYGTGTDKADLVNRVQTFFGP